MGKNDHLKLPVDRFTKFKKRPFNVDVFKILHPSKVVVRSKPLKRKKAKVKKLHRVKKVRPQVLELLDQDSSLSPTDILKLIVDPPTNLRAVRNYCSEWRRLRGKKRFAIQPLVFKFLDKDPSLTTPDMLLYLGLDWSRNGAVSTARSKWRKLKSEARKEERLRLP